jgi:hypothetical protein
MQGETKSEIIQTALSVQKHMLWEIESPNVPYLIACIFQHPLVFIDYSIRRLYELFDEESIVLSGHTTPTLLKKEILSNPFVDLALRRPLEWYNEVKERHAWNDNEI